MCSYPVVVLIVLFVFFCPFFCFFLSFFFLCLFVGVGWALGGILIETFVDSLSFALFLFGTLCLLALVPVQVEAKPVASGSSFRKYVERRCFAG